MNYFLTKIISPEKRSPILPVFVKNNSYPRTGIQLAPYFVNGLLLTLYKGVFVVPLKLRNILPF